MLLQSQPPRVVTVSLQIDRVTEHSTYKTAGGRICNARRVSTGRAGNGSQAGSGVRVRKRRRLGRVGCCCIARSGGGWASTLARAEVHHTVHGRLVQRAKDQEITEIKIPVTVSIDGNGVVDLAV